MGLGGYLTWTAAAREIYKRSGLKSFPFEQHGQTIKPVQSVIFYNNPHIWQPENAQNENCVPLQLNNPASNYCKQDTPNKAFHRFEKHIIQQVCEVYGIENPELKCDIFLDESEEKLVQAAITNLEKDFVTIEPFSNHDYTPNREYPFEKWQNIVDEISKEIQVVQVGTSPKKLKNCVDLTFTESFRIACGIIGKSKLFVSSEGGLVHGATAFNTQSVVIITGYQDKRMVQYPQNKNIIISTHGPCGLKIACKQCNNDAQYHDLNEIVEAIKGNI
mgnify:CR=1 FL=1|tara:strand:- start:25055 stop:25879 length:825 start_codon:yes stop_codon:yes gene_type:complete